jgi:hypothetical protein
LAGGSQALSSRNGLDPEAAVKARISKLHLHSYFQNLGRRDI